MSCLNVFQSKNDVFTFGKYKGKTFEQICKLDLQYIRWCQDKQIIAVKVGLIRECSIPTGIGSKAYLLKEIRMQHKSTANFLSGMENDEINDCTGFSCEWDI